MNEYVFDMGNSSKGESGYVAYVRANSPKDAADKLLSYMTGSLLAEWHTEDVDLVAFANPDAITPDKAELVEED